MPEPNRFPKKDGTDSDNFEVGYSFSLYQGEKFKHNLFRCIGSRSQVIPNTSIKRKEPVKKALKSTPG